MPGRMPIHREALKLFKGKTVFIFAHNDQPGLDAAREWQAQLTGVGQPSQPYAAILKDETLTTY